MTLVAAPLSFAAEGGSSGRQRGGGAPAGSDGEAQRRSEHKGMTDTQDYYAHIGIHEEMLKVRDAEKAAEALREVSLVCTSASLTSRA